MEEKIKTNLLRAGEYMMYSIWLQNQLADLIIFHRNKPILDEFLVNPDVVPPALQEERLKFLAKDFSQIKTEFEVEFTTSISEQTKADLHTVSFLRNALEHARVSLATSYLTYKSNTGDSTQIDFSDDKVYFDNFSAIQRLDIDSLDKLCLRIGVPHRKIR